MRPFSRGSLCLPAAFTAVALVVAGCSNPVIDVRADQLPAEVAGVEPSEYHRPGQPCLLCHGPYGGADPEMAVAGTIFAQNAQGEALPNPAPGVTITLIDSFNRSNPKPVVTNCTGNFYVPTSDWVPGFPLAVGIECPPEQGGRHVMISRISREGSCNSCHQGAPNQGSPGYVVCGASFPVPTADTCPGVPR